MRPGGVPVRVPDPARFADHKLIASARRHERSFARVENDQLQASLLIEALSIRRSFELGEALTIAENSRPKWKAAITKASTALSRETIELLDKARSDYNRA